MKTTTTLIDRDKLQAAIIAIPVWRRWIICRVLDRKTHKAANGYAVAAVDDLYNHGGELFDTLRDRSDRLYAALYCIAL
jgi:hypothetical protein